MNYLKIAIVCDELTFSALALECNVKHLTPLNYRWLLPFWKPDLVFVESAWHGPRNAWKYKIASYPDHPERSNATLAKVITRARDLGIPCIFWNKEDGVHFERFIASAALFDTIFTVDENCISRYRAVLGEQACIKALPFAVQPKIHHPSTAQLPSIARACFVGSYSHHVHNERRHWQDMMFAASEPYGLTVYDRNSARRSANYRYPAWPWIEVRKSIAHEKTANIYRDYAVSLNVNTVTDSTTMFSRRLIEIMACGGIAVTNPAPSIARYFSDYCQVVHSREECDEVLDRIFSSGGKAERERALVGAEYILREHTWAKRLAEIVDTVKI